MNDLARHRRLGHCAITVTALKLGTDARSDRYVRLGHSGPAAFAAGDCFADKAKRRVALFGLLGKAATAAEAVR